MNKKIKKERKKEIREKDRMQVKIIRDPRKRKFVLSFLSLIL